LVRETDAAHAKRVKLQSDATTSQDKLVELQDDAIAFHAIINRLRDEQEKPVKSTISGTEFEISTKFSTMGRSIQHSFEGSALVGKGT